MIVLKKLSSNLYIGLVHQGILVSNNGSQFIGCSFISNYKNLGISNYLSSAWRLQGNGQVEVIDKLSVRIERVKQVKGSWIDLLPGIFWVYRITHRTPIGETLFSLTYRMESIFLIHLNTFTTHTTRYASI